MKMIEFSVGERRTRADRISVELIDSAGRRAGLAFLDNPTAEMVAKLGAAQRVTFEAGPR